MIRIAPSPPEPTVSQLLGHERHLRPDPVAGLIARRKMRRRKWFGRRGLRDDARRDWLQANRLRQVPKT